MRSPWRDAMDGKITVLRSLLTDMAHDSVAAYYSESAALRKAVPAHRVMASAARLSTAAINALERDVRAAEPYSMTHDILSHVMRGMEEAKVVGHPLLYRPFQMTDVPTTTGLIWLPGGLSVDLPGKKGAVCTAKALYFGPAYRMLNVDQMASVKEDPKTLGVVAFIDVAKTPWLADTGKTGLIPFITPFVYEGITLDEFVDARRNRDGFEERNTPESAEIDIAMNIWPFIFLTVFMDLLRRKVLLYGGSGLERDARREAARNRIGSTVQVGTWAKADYRYPEGHISQPIDWSCQWSVREHVRRYKSGKVVVIKPYLKGPDGKPFKLPNERAHVVRRTRGGSYGPGDGHTARDTNDAGGASGDPPSLSDGADPGAV
jgi:hypothetical protein